MAPRPSARCGPDRNAALSLCSDGMTIAVSVSVSESVSESVCCFGQEPLVEVGYVTSPTVRCASVMLPKIDPLWRASADHCLCGVGLRERRSTTGLGTCLTKRLSWCAQGTLLPLVNWNTPHNQTSFWKRENYTRVTIDLSNVVPPPTYTAATLASCGTLAPAACALKQGGVVRLNVTSKLQFSVDVAIADAIILR